MISKGAWTALAISLALLCLVSAGHSQTAYKVVDIEISGNRIATESLILGVSSIEKGTALTPTSVTETIRRLYGLGIFSDVRVEAETVLGGVKIHIVVSELPKLTELVFQGNDKISDKDLRNKLGLGVGGYISPYLMFRGQQKIKEMYAEKGYFLAEVTPTLSYAADSAEASLTYTIDEKSKVKVEKVVVAGAGQMNPDDAIGKMRNRKRGFLKSSDFAQEKYDEDLEKFIDAFHNKGFIDAYLISDSMTIDSTRNRMTIYLEVYEGPRYYFGDVTFEFNEVLPDKALKRGLKYETGDVFDAKKYGETIDEFYTAYHEIGHLHARIFDKRETRADSIIDITYEFTEGLPSHVNLVKIVGNTKTKDKVIRREISMLPGKIFNRALVIRSIRDVMALNYFAQVNPIPIELPNGDVDLEFEIEEKQTGQINAGAGYNSQDKLVGNVGIGIPNFRGMGQNLAFSVDFGSRVSSFTISFTEPWLFGKPTSLGSSLYITNRRWFEDYTEGRQGGSIRVGRRLRWPDNYFRLYGSYRLERTRFYDFDDDYRASNSYKATYYYDDPTVSGRSNTFLGSTTYGEYPGSLIAFNEDWLTASRLAFTIYRDSRNLPEFATKGSSFSYTFEQTGGFMGGYWNYQKHSFNAAKFIPVWGKLALAAKVQYGVVTAPQGDDRILISDRFTPGGTAYDGIVRGYDDGSLTPDSIVNQSDTLYYYDDPSRIVGIDPPDDTVFSSYRARVRGKYMIVANLELQFPIVEQQIYGLAFFDAGNSWLIRENIKPITGLYKGVGLGFRIVIPGMGTLGFDFGYPLDDPPNGADRTWKPHFQIGTTFR